MSDTLIPTFRFLRRDAAQPASARKFMEAILATRRFWRNEKSQIFFEVAPGDYCLIERKQGLASVLEDGSCLSVTGDDFRTDDAHVLWVWLTAHKWKLPRIESAVQQLNRMAAEARAVRS